MSDESEVYITTIGFDAGKLRCEIGDRVTAEQLSSKRAVRDLLEMGAIRPVTEEETADASSTR